MEEAKEDCASKKKKTEEDLGDSRRGERRIYLLTKGCKRFGQVPLETLRDRGNLWDEKEGLGDKLWRYIVKKKRNGGPREGVTLHNKRSRKRRYPDYKEIRMV